MLRTSKSCVKINVLKGNVCNCQISPEKVHQLSLQNAITIPTRKSSCLNARGIPPAAYQVLAMLGGGGAPGSRSVGGYLVPGQGVPHPRSGGGVPNPRSGEYPIPGWGRGYPSQVWGSTPSQAGGVPIPGPGGTTSKVRRGVPHPRSGGYPIPFLGGYPSQVWGSTPSQVQGVPHPRSGGVSCPG